ncbi:hypothetical protein ACFC0D_38055 [Streptomyces sp. NPDC056222]|uniref:hypothetical protein n=1 Tax=Streptomyces sp. NPDC056222 TaxID=3345749 RepID=UPI0035DD2B5E
MGDVVRHTLAEAAARSAADHRSERQRLEVVVTSVVEKRLGALSVSDEFLRRLDVAGIVDELCPGDATARLTHQ